jgi:tetratricopeptide (TPR) repeat protein
MRLTIKNLSMFFLVVCALESSGQQTDAAAKSTVVQKATGADKVSTQETTAVPAETTSAADSAARANTRKQISPQLNQALATYQQQAIDAHKSGDHQREAVAAINTGRAAEALAVTDPSQSPKAEAAYRSAIVAARESSQVMERSWAANNLAVLLLKSGRKQEALQAIQDVEVPDSMPAQQRAIFNYNIARTYELNGQTEFAWKHYSDAYSANPNFTQAAEGGFRLLAMETTPQVQEGVRLSNDAIKSGHASVAREPLLILLHRWATAGDAQQLLANLVRCYAEQRLPPRDFRAHEAGRLSEAVAAAPRLKEAADQVSTAYDGEISPRPFEAIGAFSMWRNSGWQSTSLASLLKVAAAWFADNKRPALALGRYMAAWELTRDPQYAMEFASLVSQQPQLDQSGLLNDLLESMFMEKGASYAKQDWESIFRMHVAIATILEHRGQWGGNGEVRGAQFQWEHALTAYDQLHKVNPRLPPVPGLHAHLGTCYSHVGKTNLAAREFVLAAEAFVTTGDFGEARRNIDLANQSGIGALSPEDARRMQKVQARIAQHE